MLRLMGAFMEISLKINGMKTWIQLQLTTGWMLEQ